MHEDFVGLELATLSDERRERMVTKGTRQYAAKPLPTSRNM